MVGARQLQNYNRLLGWRVNGGPGWVNSMTVRNIWKMLKLLHFHS